MVGGYLIEQSWNHDPGSHVQSWRLDSFRAEGEDTLHSPPRLLSFRAVSAPALAMVTVLANIAEYILVLSPQR